MKNIFQQIDKIVLSLLLIAVFTSCKDEDPEEVELASIQSNLQEYGLTENNRLENGIYLKFHNDTAENRNNAKPKKGQTVVLSFTGEYLNHEIFETTDESKGEIQFPSRYFVYGPYRVVMGTLVYGVDTTLKYMSVGDSATMIIPSWYAWFNSMPVVYHIKLHEIISDVVQKENDVYGDYLNINDYNIQKDTIYSNNIHFKTIKNNLGTFPDTIYTYTSKDTLKLKLTARYAEVDSYLTSVQEGRIFYPRGIATEEIDRVYGEEYYFPFIPAIDSTLKRMVKGDIVEITCHSGFAYGQNGFYDPYYNVAIVPPYVSVNYRIELTDIISSVAEE